MYRDLNGKVAVVTGGSKGIGAGIAERFGKEHMAVVINYLGDHEGARKTAATVIKNGGQAVSIHADVSTEAGIASLVKTAESEFGRLDVWVNNAGMEIKAPTHEVSLDDWNKVIAINQTGVFLGARAALNYFLDHHQPGNIINITSVHEQIPWPTFASCTAAKGAVKLFTETIAMEYANRRIRVNAIGPGAIETPINAEKFADKAQYAQTVAMIPQGRLGKPEDVAPGAAWLASTESSYVTGTTLFIDGGMTLYPAFKDGQG